MSQRDETLKIAAETESALLEAQETFNRAKKEGKDRVEISRRTLYLLIVLAGHALGLRVEDSSQWD